MLTPEEIQVLIELIEREVEDYEDSDERERERHLEMLKNLKGKLEEDM